MRQLLIFLFLTSSHPLQLVPPDGEIKGKFYVTPAEIVTTSRESEVIVLSIERNTITETLETLLRLEEIEERLTPEINKDYKAHEKFAKEFLPTVLGNYLTLLGSDTAEASSKKCTTMGGHIYEIKTSKDFEVVTELSDRIVNELKATGQDITSFEEFWQEIILSQEKLPIFLRTSNSVPDKLGESTTTVTLTGLSEPEQCAFVKLKTKAYSTDKCKDNNVKKNIVCKLENDEGSQRLPLLLAQRQNKLLKSLKTSIPSLLDNLKLPPKLTPPLPEVAVSVFDKNEALIIRNLRTLKLENVSFKVFVSLINYNRVLIDNIQKLNRAIETKDISHVLQTLVSSAQNTTITSKLEELKTKQIIDTEMYTTETKLNIRVKTGSKNEQMLASSLFPLIFNSQQPQFLGKTLRSTTECLYDVCQQDPCHISTVTPVPCCNLNVLGLEGYCPNIPSTKLEYLAAMDDNQYLLVSSSGTLITSHTCPNIHVKVSGSVILTIINQTSGCDISVGEISLPIIGTMSAEVFSSPSKRDKINLIQRYQPEFPNLDEETDSYLVPVSVVIGTVATVIGTALALYLCLQKRVTLAVHTHEDDDQEPSTSYPLQSYPLRPILKPPTSSSNMISYSEDSDSSSSPSN